MKIIKLLLFITVLVGFAAITQTTVVQASDDVPHFQKHENYASVRSKMLKAGWKPFHAEDADTCEEGDVRCQGRPEMVSCAGTGMANCKFLWEKNGDTIAILTVGEDPAVYDGVDTNLDKDDADYDNDS